MPDAQRLGVDEDERNARVLAAAIEPGVFRAVLPDPQTARHVRESVERFIADTTFAPHAVVVTAPLRPLLAEFFERVGPRIDVYAFSEIPPTVDLEPAAVLTGEDGGLLPTSAL